MKKLFFIGTLFVLMATAVSAQTKKVGMLIGSESVSALESVDEKKAAEWFTSTYPEGVVVTPSTLNKMDDLAVLWVAVDRVGIEKGWTNLPAAFSSSATIDALMKFAQRGGSLLLTNHATQLTVALGRIDNALAPGIFGNGAGGDNPDVWGVHPIIGNVDGQIYNHSEHPIYKDMTYHAELFAGIYCFESAGVKGDHNCMWDLNAYGLAANPNVVKSWEELTNSTVLGTWNHVVDYCCAGIVDFEPTTTFAGRILAVGLAAYEWDLGGVENTYADQLQLFTSNCINYLLNPTGEQTPADDPTGEPLAAVEGKVGMLIGSESISTIEDDDEKAAALWFQSKFADGIIITPTTLDKLAEVSTLWVAVDRMGIEAGAFNLPEPFGYSDVVKAIADHVKAGGSLLLTNHATQLTSAIGRIDEKYSPNIFGAGEGGENNDAWGVNANIGLAFDHVAHAIYTGLAKNNTTYADHSFFPLIGGGHKEDHNCMWDFNAEGYALDEAPNKLSDFEAKTTATVLGTWQHVTDYAVGGIVEFLPTSEWKGTVLACGLAAYEWSQNSGDNTYQQNVEYLTWNSLNYLNGVSVKTITTGVRSVEASTENDRCDVYDMSGRKMGNGQLKQGVYVMGGKKIVVR